MPGSEKQLSQNDLSTLEHGHFNDHVGTAFQVQVGDAHRCTLTLVEVKTGKARPKLSFSLADGTTRETRERPFTLIFEGEEGAAMEQDSYQISHGVLGSGLLCLSPHGRKKAEDAQHPDCHDHALNVIYQAVFS